MLHSFFKVALRYIVKNKLYSLLNIFGLTVGLICFVILGLYVREQFDKDMHHLNSEQIYRVLIDRNGDDDNIDWAAFSEFPMADLLNEGVPEIKNTTRFGIATDIVIEASDKKFKVNNINFSDPSVFQIFDFEVLALSKPLKDQTSNEVVLVRSEAIRLFDSIDNALGKILKINDFDVFKVIAVIENLGQETHLDFKYLLPIAQVDNAYSSDGSFRVWGNMSAFPVYVLVEPNIEIQTIEIKAEQLLRTHLETAILKLEPINQVYFSDIYSMFKKQGDKQFVLLYLFVAILILFIACINYINLSTARYLKRAKEVGIRKTVGGQRSQIIFQFYLESITISAAAVILAICFTEILLDPFNNFAESSIAIDYASPLTYGLALAGIFGLGTLAGLYPAIFLSRFSANQILSGKVTKGKSGLFLRNTLVVIQFFICIGLFTATNIILKQFEHLKQLDLGLDKDQVLMIPLNDEGLKQSYQAFKSELSANPLIEWTTGAGPRMFGGRAEFYLEIAGSEETTPISIFPVDADFFQKFGIELIEGRLYEAELSEADNNFLIVNEALTKAGGWEDLAEKFGQNVFKADVGVPNLGGVVEDFVFFSVKDEVTPAAYLYRPNSSEQAYVKIRTDNFESTLAFIEATYTKFAKVYPFEYSFLDQAFAEQYRQEEKLSKIFSTFSGVAILIALLGLFGLSIFLAEQRLKEFSIRKVLGASTSHLVWLMNTGISKILIVSTVLAVPLVYYLMQKWVSAFAFRINLETMYFITPVFWVVLFAWLTTLYQSLTSAKRNPIDSLRNE